ncbi:hypothetical protein LSAT2_016901, partial [Lamellibrachia satsuma]
MGVVQESSLPGQHCCLRRAAQYRPPRVSGPWGNPARVVAVSASRQYSHIDRRMLGDPLISPSTYVDMSVLDVSYAVLLSIG